MIAPRSGLPRGCPAVMKLAPLLLAGCSAPWQSALRPAGPHAHSTYRLFLLFMIVGTVVWLLVMIALGLAVVRGRRRSEVALDESSRRRARNVVVGAIGATTGVLLTLLVSDFLTGRSLAQLRHDRPALTIELIGNQWWWEAHYEHVEPQQRVTTANELHIPVGRPVLVKLKSRDVIHSMWVPNLSGKQDMIPGYTTTLWLRADSAGQYRAQCAEYCGHQHANMALLVIAQPEAEFIAWWQAQLQPAAEPASPEQRRGRDVFLGSACVMCHAIRGTPAGGRTGPELTHLASRSTLAAGTLPNNTGSLLRWITDPQHVKPGVRMPSVPLNEADLQALVSYLESLR